MPMFIVNTNVATDQIPDDFITEVSTVVANILNKPESYVCVEVHSGLKMSFGGSTSPCANCELHSIGGVGGKLNNSHAKELFPLMKKFLGIDGNRMYIQFIDIPRLHIMERLLPKCGFLL